MSDEKTRIIITGSTGTVGTYASLFMGRLGAADHLYIASRTPEKAANVFYNSQVNALEGTKDLVAPLTRQYPRC
jgi:saccharopine dehydrogenase-like NADP-dependent oxidoreductase